MIYTYVCHNCLEEHDVIQRMTDRHEYTCPLCGEKCTRVYHRPQVRKNEGFYSVTVGEWVDSHDDFEKKLRKTRYITGEYERLGDNSKPEDEWVEKRHKKEQKQKEMIKKEQAKADMVYYNAQKG